VRLCDELASGRQVIGVAQVKRDTAFACVEVLEQAAAMRVNSSTEERAHRRKGSPEGGSILMTSAPRSTKSLVA
jgi:hypothetical protein